MFFFRDAHKLLFCANIFKSTGDAGKSKWKSMEDSTVFAATSSSPASSSTAINKSNS